MNAWLEGETVVVLIVEVDDRFVVATEWLPVEFAAGKQLERIVGVPLPVVQFGIGNAGKTGRLACREL